MTHLREDKGRTPNQPDPPAQMKSFCEEDPEDNRDDQHQDAIEGVSDEKEVHLRRVSKYRSADYRLAFILNPNYTQQLP